MASFHRAGQARINAFHVGEDYLFRHYFEDDVYDELRQYYSRYDYRYEVPASRFERVERVLAEHGYALLKIDDPEPFAVVKRKYTAHPDVLFKASVLHRSLGRFNCFVMKDRETAESAVAEGARPLADTDLELGI